MRSLVINLTRFGDLLQSQPVLTALARQQQTTALLCLKNFLPAGRLLRDIDNIFSLPGPRLLAELDTDWRTSLHTLWNFIEKEVRAFAPTTVINLTPTLSARLLTRLIPAQQIQGFGMDSFGFAMHSSPWATFLQASSRSRGTSPFNLVDLFWKTAGLSGAPLPYHLAQPTEQHRHAMQDWLVANAPPECTGFIALQPGASATKRQWPVEYFASLGQQLWKKKKICPVLLGSDAEGKLAQQYARHTRTPFLNAIGQTSLDELAALLTHMKLLVTNDTGTMHLAAGLGLPLCAFFLATAQPCDTGPYCPGNICLEPAIECHPCDFGQTCDKKYACRWQIPAATVTALVLDYLEKKQWSSSLATQAASVCRIWETSIHSDGFPGLVSLSGHDHEDRTIWLEQQRHFYRQFLDNTTCAPAPGTTRPLSFSAAQQIHSSLHTAHQLVSLLRQQALLLLRAPSPKMKQKFLANVERLAAHWQHSASFAVLGDMWTEQLQEAGRDFARLPALLEHYEQCIQTWQASIAQSV